MQSKTTFFKIKKAFKSGFLALGFVSLFSGLATAQTYTNGNISTGANLGGGGAAAPAGTTWSQLQGSNTSLGWGANITAGLTIVDDLVVPAGPSWALNKITFFAYSTGFTGTTSPFNDVRVRIYNSDPQVGNPTPIWGDLTTSRFNSSSFADMYRTAATADLTRKIWKIEANVNATLAPGTYWLEWQLGNGGISNFSPPNTVVGNPSPGGNSKQRAIATGVWTALVDAGGGGAQDQHFIINYDTAPCSGTPAPGNTVSSSASVCPNTPFTLSAQNATVGTGVTYQWQSSATGVAGSFTNVAGATNATLVIPNLTAATYYQVIVTCSGASTTSTPTQVNVTPASSCYCIPPPSDCSDDDAIFNIKLGTLNNTTTCAPTGYTNYTTNNSIAIPDVVAGATNPITLTAGSGTYTVSVAVWIDYNKNGTFEASEFTLIGTAATPIIRNGNIVVPASASLGQTRMRVRAQFSSPFVATGACAAAYIGYGETEDYTVNIVPCTPTTITTQPVNATAVCGATTTFSVAIAGSIPAVYWEYRTTATGVWQNVPNAAPYSGVNTATLSITPVTAGLNGYQYRAVYSGACAGVDFSNSATLTVNALATTVTPASATICNGSIQALSITNILSSTTLYEQNFSNWAGLGAAGWSVKNNSTNPTVGLGAWDAGTVQYTGALTPFSAPEYAAASYFVNNDGNGGGNISGWLFAPQTTITNGDILTFYVNALNPAAYADRLQIRMSTAGASTNVGSTPASVGDFTTLLLDINPTYALNAMPTTWTQRTVTISGLAAPVSGRIAFRYFIENDNVNGYFLGLDDIKYVAAPTIAQGTWGGPAGTIFTDDLATVPYTAGTTATTVYVKPTVSGVNNYTVSFATASCQATTATIPVTARQLPTSVSTPANRTICTNGSTYFKSTVVGGSVSGLQWQVSTDNGATYTNIAANANYSGVTTDSLVITNAPVTFNNYRYRLEASATPCTGPLNSTAATLTVNPLPVLTISASPSTSIYPGQTATISVASSTTVPAGGYRWFRNGMLLQNVNGNTLVIDVDSIGNYSVSAADANACGSAVPAEITITAAENTAMFVYPSPNSGQFQVRYYSAAGNNPLPRIVNVYDSKGARVYSKSYNIAGPYSRMDVNMSNQQKGIYQVELTDRNGNRLKTGRVVIL